jgi:hypothetical protein
MTTLIAESTLIPLAGMAIPITAIVMGIAAGIVGMITDARKRERMFALYHQERMAAIEKGMELPPLPEEFFYNGKQKSPHHRLLMGLILLFLGGVLFLALYVNQGIGTALYALIPAGIGVAMLIYYFAIGKKQAETMEEERKAKQAEASRGRSA